MPCQEKKQYFTNFVTCSGWQNFYLVIFVVSCVIDCIEGMTTFTTLMKATEYSVILKN